MTDPQQQAQRDLIDPTDGENRAIRCFLMLYGSSGPESYTIGQMRRHLQRSGYPFWPEWVLDRDDLHLNKADAQSWLRHLFGLEAVASALAAQPKSRIGTAEYLTPVAAEPQLGSWLNDLTKRYEITLDEQIVGAMAWRAALAASATSREATIQPGLNVPDGWKLVPIEPTEDMLDAGFGCDAAEMARQENRERFAKSGVKLERDFATCGQILTHQYRAILSAAPSPSVAAEEPVKPDLAKNLVRSIRVEIAHAKYNGHVLMPRPGQSRGEPGVSTTNIEAAIEGWQRENRIGPFAAEEKKL